jgi:hypothetical protein
LLTGLLTAIKKLEKFKPTIFSERSEKLDSRCFGLANQLEVWKYTSELFYTNYIENLGEKFLQSKNPQRIKRILSCIFVGRTSPGI